MRRRNQNKEINSDLEFLNIEIKKYKNDYVFDVPEDFPTDLQNKLYDYFKKSQTVEKAYLSCIDSGTDPIYILVLDSRYPSDTIITEVTSFCQPMVKNISLNITMLHSRLGEVATNGKFPFFICEKATPDDSYYVWNYIKPHNTKRDGYGWATLNAIGKKPNGELFVFDIYSEKFLKTVYLDKFKDNFYDRTHRVSSVYDLQALFFNHENRENRKIITNNVDAPKILSVLKNKKVYSCARKINRILELKQKKHKIIITYTTRQGLSESKHTVTIYDDIQNYRSLVDYIYSFWKNSKKICPHCGRLLVSGKCEHCKDVKSLIKQANELFYKEQFSKLMFRIIIAVVSFAIMFLFRTPIFISLIDGLSESSLIVSLLSNIFLGFGGLALIQAYLIWDKIRDKKKHSV